MACCKKAKKLKRLQERREERMRKIYKGRRYLKNERRKSQKRFGEI